MRVMRAQLLLFVQILSLTPTSPCETDDCSCGDWFYDNCGHTTPSQSLHAGGLQECFDTCELFASFGQCNFYIFLTNPGAHDNCLLFNSDAKTYLETCPVYGQPLYDSDGFVLMEHCGQQENCKECQNYSDTPCGGFRHLDCLVEHATIGHFENVSPKEDCAAQCRNIEGARYSIYYSESSLCECYASGTRECAQVMVDVDIGTVDC